MKRAARKAPTPVPKVRADIRPHALALGAVLLLTLLAYSNSFRSGFPFDNENIILRDSRIQAATPENIHLILHHDYWFQTSTSSLYRPLTTLSYLFNYAILGETNHPSGYHALNLALHAANIALVYLLGLLLLRDVMPAACMAAMWAVHPVLTESVTNIVGRADLLAGLGVLGGLLCHVYGARAAGVARWLWTCGIAIASAIGIFSKENAVVLLAVMAIYDFTWPAAARWRARIAGYIAAIVPMLVYFQMRAAVHATLPTSEVPFLDNPLVGADFFAGRLTAVKVIGKYFALLVWPINLSSDYGYNQIRLAVWNALPALALCLALAAAATWAWRHNPPICFFIAFFFATLAPMANIAILIGTIMAERFLYLPAIGFAGCLVIGITAAVKRWSLAPRTVPATVAAICLLFAVRTFARNFDWFDDQTLRAATIRVSPDCHRPHSSFANTLIAAGPARIDDAIREADRALAILADVPDARNATYDYVIAGTCYRAKGDTLAGTPNAAPWYQRSVETLERARRIDEAQIVRLRAINEAEGKHVGLAGSYLVYLELGRTYMRISDPHRAIEAFDYGRGLRPDIEFFEEMAAAYHAMHDPRQAEITLLEGVVANPAYTRLAAGLPALYRESDPESCALRGSGNSLDLDVTCPLVRQQICTAAHNVVALHRRRGDGPSAARAKRNAVVDLGCPAQMVE
jgi:hypothetical protein